MSLAFVIDQADLNSSRSLSNDCKFFSKSSSVSTLHGHIARSGSKHYKFYMKSCEEAGAKPNHRAMPKNYKDVEER